MGRVNSVEQEMVGLRAEMVVFETKEEEELGEGERDEREDWNDEMWEARAMHIRRMELIRRATAPVRLSGPHSVDLVDVLSTALTRNKAQLFPTRRRPKLREIEKASP